MGQILSGKHFQLEWTLSDLTALKDAGPRSCHWASAEDYLECSKVGNRRPSCLANCSYAAIWRGRFETTPMIMLNKSNETSFMWIHIFLGKLVDRLLSVHMM